MCFKACENLNTIAGVKATVMSVDRIAVELKLDNPNIDFEFIRQHPLIKRDGIDKVPGQQGTVRLDECGDIMYLGSFHADDVVTLINAATCAAPI